MQPTSPSTAPEPAAELSVPDAPAQGKGRIARLAAGVAAGAGLGLGMYLLVGCTSGCAFLSSPILAVLYGAVIGGVAATR